MGCVVRKWASDDATARYPCAVDGTSSRRCGHDGERAHDRHLTRAAFRVACKLPRYFDAERLHRIHEKVETVVIESSGLTGDVIAHFDSLEMSIVTISVSTTTHSMHISKKRPPPRRSAE